MITQTDAPESGDARTEDAPVASPPQESLLQGETDAASDELAEVRELRASIESITRELLDTKDQLLRKAAEFQNYRRRTQKEVAFSSELGKVSVLEPILDVFDDLRRSLEASRETQEDGAAPEASLEEGIELVYRKLEETLARFGVKRIDAEGRPFDENLHEAMMRQPAPDDDTESGVILTEIQPGYVMGDRILRHAKVVVAE